MALPKSSTPVGIPHTKRTERLVIAGMVAALGIAMSLAVWIRAESTRRSELTAMLGTIADRMTSRVEWQMQQELDGVRFLATLMQATEGSTPAWPLQAALILQEHPGLDYVAWVWPDSTVHGFCGRDTSVRLEEDVLHQAMFQLQTPVREIQERWGDSYQYTLFIPILVDTTRMGVVVGQVHVDSLWVRRQPSLLGATTMILLGEDDRRIPLRQVPDSLAAPWMTMRRTITAPSGAPLRVDLTPSDEFVRQVTRQWPLLFLITGVFLSLAIGALVVQFLRLRDFSLALEQTNRDLDARLTELSKRDQELRSLNDELGERVQQRTAELSRALREVETFNHSVSHDLRSPIGAILNFAALLEEDHGQGIDPEARRLLERIHSAAGRANQLLDSLAEFSSAEVEPGDVRVLDMNDLAERAFAEASARESGREEIDFTVGDLPPARGEPGLVQRVFVNLIGNALKYSRGRAPRVVRVGGHVENGEAVYCVTDNGCGFDPAHEAEVFQAFRRLHGSDIEGSGLGLAIVAKVVGRLGGRVWARSDGANGASFYFTLSKAEASGP